MKIVPILLVLVLPAGVSSAYDTAYVDLDILGWKLKINESFVRTDSQLCYSVISKVVRQLNMLENILPKKALAEVKGATIWIENDSLEANEAYYYTYTPELLKAEDIHPEKSRSIEVMNARKFFLASFEWPLRLLHVIAYAYHHRVLGHDYAVVGEVYRHAYDEHLYDESRTIYNQREYRTDRKSYVIKNSHVYFAELTEAFFGKNDWYPYTREELEDHDPLGYEMIKRAWGAE